MFMILSKGRKPKKQALLEMLEVQDVQTLALALSYAQNIQIYGVDVTQKLETATQNEEALARAYQKGYFDAMQTNSQMKEQESKTKWIPVSEKLPKSCGVYIVTREFNDGFVCADLTDACYFDGTSTWHNDNRINHDREYVDKKIKAWMPLPKPYKAESEG